jgi:NAD(P) transhydrogenase
MSATNDPKTNASDPANDYDLIVLGGGPAGSSGALAAAIFGKRVALIEQAVHVGGAGLNTGTVPSKALRESALVISGWRTRKLLGVELSLREHATLGELMHHHVAVRDTIAGQTEQRMRDHGVVRVRGRGSFVDPHTVRVVDESGRETRLTGAKILLATGSSPQRPKEFPFEHPRVHDSDEILELTQMPRKLAVVGAGVIGAEYACTFAALGIEVHVVDGRDALLSFLDAEISAAIEAGMRGADVHFHWKERVVSCDAPATGDVVLTLSSGAKLAVSDVLVAAGRTSNTAGLELAAAGLTPGERGLVPVNGIFQTSVPHIYAAGDIIGAPALASTGMEQARVAMCHAFALLDKEFEALLPTGIYTIPEASMVGITEKAARDSGVETVVGRARYRESARGQLIGDDHGFLKLVFRRDDMRLLGVHVVGEQATELVHIGLVAMLNGANADLFSRACFNFPTLGDLYKYASYDAVLRRMGQELTP